jgi:hypothetical protein
MQTTIRSRTVWLFAVLALVAVLAFSACGARNNGLGGADASSRGGQTTTQQQQSAVQNPNVQSVQSADQQVQDAVNALNAVSSDANQDFSTQDTESVP